jgi:hypothetical protein
LQVLLLKLSIIKKKALVEALFLGDKEEMKKSGVLKKYTDKEIESMSLGDAKKLYSSTKKSWDVPANNKLKKQLIVKIEKEDPKFFKSAKKKALTENEITNSPVVQNLEKKAFDFFNQPKVVALFKKELDKLSPEKKAELAKKTVQEGEGNDFSSFKASIEKAIDKALLNEDMHDTLRKLGGYKPGQEATALDKNVGKVLTNLGVANIMSMGFLPALSAMALDYFGGTDVVNTVSQVVGDGGAAAALSVVAGLVGGGLLWKIGKILQNEKTSGNTALFN